MPRFIRTNQDLPKFSDYTRYRPYLRKDFEYRCAYCEITETSVFGIIAFGIDHFRPKTRFPDLICSYENLYYCCNDCNRYKGRVWPSLELVAAGYFFPDPCECDMLSEHLRETEDCRLEAITNAGMFALEILRLNRAACLRFRGRRKLLQRRIIEYRKLTDALKPVEIRDLLAQILTDLEIECAEHFG
jgi:hypothetical protein